MDDTVGATQTRVPAFNGTWLDGNICACAVQLAKSAAPTTAARNAAGMLLSSLLLAGLIAEPRRRLQPILDNVRRYQLKFEQTHRGVSTPQVDAMFDLSP